MSIKDTLEKAYGSIPKEVGFAFSVLDFMEFRGIKYYYWRIVRYFTR